MLSDIVASTLFWGAFATLVACIEIESEGKFGWAEKAPTWYRAKGLAARLYGLVMSGKPLTGYHTFMFFFPVFIFHSHFFQGVAWTPSGELLAWSLYFAWCPMWDYHWFVLNPHYRGKFKRNKIWWHSKSWWPAGLFPVDYLVGAGVSVALAAATILVTGSNELFLRHLWLLVGFLAYTFGLHLVAPLYRWWYYWMRERDDRGLVRRNDDNFMRSPFDNR